MKTLIDDILSGSLYNKTDLKDLPLKDLKDLHSVINKPSKMNDRDHFDLYCEGCGRISVFKKEGIDFTQEGSGLNSGYISPPKSAEEIKQNLIKDSFYELVVSCTRNSVHLNRYFFVIKNREIQKIGQYPSLIDVEINSFRKYESIIGKLKVKELIRAEGLVNHNVGIGSFVYLRRVLEALIQKAESKASKEKSWDDEKFANEKMTKKIKLLKNYLPEIFVKNAQSYSILSKGIHQLKEGECKKYFPVLKDLIILILEDEYSNKKKEELESRITNDISNIGSNLNKPN